MGEAGGEGLRGEGHSRRAGGRTAAMAASLFLTNAFRCFWCASACSTEMSKDAARSVHPRAATLALVIGLEAAASAHAPLSSSMQLLSSPKDSTPPRPQTLPRHSHDPIPASPTTSAPASLGLPTIKRLLTSCSDMKHLVHPCFLFTCVTIVSVADYPSAPEDSISIVSLALANRLEPYCRAEHTEPGTGTTSHSCVY